MNDIERELKNEFDRMATEVGRTRPLPAKVRSRAVRRRNLTAAGLGAAGLLLIAAVASATQFGGRNTSLPVTGNPTPGDSTTAKAEGPVGVSIYRGSIAEPPTEGFCMDVEYAMEATDAQHGSGSCGKVRPGRLFFGIGADDEGPPILYGLVSPNIREVELRNASNDPVMQQATRSAREEFGVPLRYFVFFPVDTSATRIVALVAGGGTVDSQRLPPLQEEGGAEEPAEYEVVAAGVQENVEWELLRQGDASGGQCLTMAFGEDQEMGATTKCSLTLGADGEPILEAALIAVDGLPGYVAVYGPVDEAADAVEIELRRGRPVYGSDLYVGHGVGYFVGFIPTEDGEARTGRVVARNKADQVIATTELCELKIAEGATSSCGF